MWPLDVATHRRLPEARRAETATTAKRSLYDPLGLPHSSLKKSLPMPACGPIATDSTRGVFPSPSVIRVAAGTGAIRSANRHTLMPSPR